MKRKRNIDRKRIYKTSKYEFCECAAPFVEKFEDYTYKSLGQELTRNIEVKSCPLCNEKLINGPTLVEMENEIEAKVLALANERFEVPEGHIYLNYHKNVDVLVIGYKSNRPDDSKVDLGFSKEDMDKGLIYNFDGEEKLKSIEVLGFYGKFTIKE
jgi:hypothetical protein